MTPDETFTMLANARLATQLEQMRRERDEWKRVYTEACDLLDKTYADLTAQNAKLARIRNVSAPAPVRDAVLRIIDEKEGGQ